MFSAFHMYYLCSLYQFRQNRWFYTTYSKKSWILYLKYILVVNHLRKLIASFSHTHTHASFSYLFALHLPPFPPLTHPCARPLTRDKPCPCPPLTPAVEVGVVVEGPSAPQKPEWLRAAHIHWGNKRSLCQEGRGGARERGAREIRTLHGPTYYL